MVVQPMRRLNFVYQFCRPCGFSTWRNPAKDSFCSFQNESRVISINCGPMPQQLRLWISSRPFMDPLNWKDRCRQLIRKPIFFRLLQQSNTTPTTAVQVGVKDVRTRLNSRAATRPTCCCSRMSYRPVPKSMTPLPFDLPERT